MKKEFGISLAVAGSLLLVTQQCFSKETEENRIRSSDRGNKSISGKLIERALGGIPPGNFPKIMPLTSDYEPVIGMDFNARVNGEGGVDFFWSIESESDDEIFVIERSLDGEEFEEIVKVDSGADTVDPENYNAKDNHPYLGMSFYRLKKVAADGSIDYSDLQIVKALTVPVNNLRVSPIPTDGEINIHLKSKAAYGIVSIFDIEGRLIYSAELHNRNNSLFHSIDLTGILTTGIYHVKLKAGREDYIKQIAVN